MDYKHVVTSLHDLRSQWHTELRAQGRSLRWLADQTGIARRTVYAYSTGQRRPPDSWLERVAEALGLRGCDEAA